MRLGVMGGTFDPIHHGHLVAASEVQSLFDLDEVVFVPTGEPWQKEGRDVAPAEHRYLMTVVATASNPRFTVSRVDIDRDGPTYTIDTLRDLHAQRPTTSCSSSPGPTRWRRSCRGRTPTSCSTSPASSG
jgi:nicotinate-nucleotide adenylyltransferase